MNTNARSQMLVAGVVLQTQPGEADAVRASLGDVPGLRIEYSDGDRQLAGVWTAESGQILVDDAEALVADHEKLLGVFPTFIGIDDDP